MSGPTLEVNMDATVGNLTIALSLRADTSRPILIVGPNGAGKTTALMLILGALRPDRGHVILGGQPLLDRASGVDIPVERRGIGFLPQRYGLFPHLDAAGNVAYGIRKRRRDERKALALAALARLGVAALASRRPDTLSGGEAQRVALARALASGPRALLLDEPLAALDVSLRREVRHFLASHLRTLGIPTIIVTHDRADAQAFDGDVVVIERGAAVQRGSMSELTAHPATNFVRRFVGAPLDD